jgi:hypothetical protein
MIAFVPPARTLSLNEEQLCGIGLHAGDCAFSSDRQAGRPTDAPINVIREEVGATFANAWVATHQSDLYQGEGSEAVLASLNYCLKVWFATGYDWARKGYPLGLLR